MADDYAKMGITIQQAMVHYHSKKGPSRPESPRSLLWDGKDICTAHALAVPSKGRYELKLIHREGELRQGCDVSIDDGGSILQDGNVVPTLRTWWLPELEDTVRYDF